MRRYPSVFKYFVLIRQQNGVAHWYCPKEIDFAHNIVEPRVNDLIPDPGYGQNKLRSIVSLYWWSGLLLASLVWHSLRPPKDRFIRW